jgi:AcrR family transcriptional regulator
MKRISNGQGAQISPIKRRIIDEAARLFHEQGYLAASMRELAARVNLKVSSLYSHIGNKEELLHALCFESARQYLEGLSAIERQESSAMEKTKCLLALHIRIATNDVASVTVFNDEWRHLSEPFLGEFQQLRKNYEFRFERIIQQAIDEGEFKPVNPTIALYTMLASLRWIHLMQPKRKNWSDKDLEVEITRLLLHGLAKSESQY